MTFNLKTGFLALAATAGLLALVSGAAPVAGA